jgi:hydrogenase-4 component F
MQLLIWLALGLPILTGLATLPLKDFAAIRYTNLAGSAATTGVLLTVIVNIAGGNVLTEGFFYVDQLSAVLLLVVALLSFTACLFSQRYMEKEVEEGHMAGRNLPRFYALFQLFVFAMIGVLVVGNLGLMWVAVELTTLASALLVAIALNKDALEAAWKYVIICSVGIALALLGTMILYYAQVQAVGDAQALNWAYLKQIASQLDPKFVKLGFIFILIGYGTKAGLAPMHTWLPDAHSQAPSPVSGLLSGSLLSCAMYALMRNMVVVQGAIGPEFAHRVLLTLGVASVAWAIPFVLVQHDMKRLLAYSSVEHMGLIALGLGIGSQLAVYAALLHIVNHALAKSSLFYMAGTVTQEYGTKKIDAIRGIARVAPGLATMLIVGALAITGTPPFNIFVSKFMIIWSMFQANRWLLGGIVLLLLVGIFAGLMYATLKMAFGAPSVERPSFKMSGSAATAILVSLCLVLVGGLYLPPALHTVLTRAAEIVLGG